MRVDGRVEPPIVAFSDHDGGLVAELGDGSRNRLEGPEVRAHENGATTGAERFRERPFRLLRYANGIERAQATTSQE